MGFLSTLFFAASLATLRIILQRKDMLQHVGVFGLGIGALVVWLVFGPAEDERGTDRESETPYGDPSTVYTGPASVEQWINEASRAANLTSVPRDLILAVIWQESAGNPDAVGSAGEQGLMQVTKIAAEDVGEPQPSTKASAQRQVTVGAKYLAKCFDYVGGDTFKALRCYNEGPPPLTRTASRQYASHVLDKRRKLTDDQ